MPRFEFDVFLSFASLNESMARILYNQLTRSGLKVFWSDETLKRRVGKSWLKEIEKSLEASKHMVLLWTNDAKQSHWVEDEYTAFYSEIQGKKERLLVPVMGEGMQNKSLPLFLRKLQTYPMNGSSEVLITSLGGHYISLEQENERLKQELEDIRKEVQLLRAQNGKAKQADLERISRERDEWRQKYADLENRALEESTRLNSVIDEKGAQILVFENRIAILEKGSPSKKTTHKPSVKGPAKTFIDDHDIEFILIEPGTFMMGQEKIATPVHKVEITRPFYLGKYPVTQAQWEAVIRGNPSNFKGQRSPVESVSWNDVKAFLKNLNNGKESYQLPTEAQWEFACRAGTRTTYSFGNNKDELGQYAWCLDNSGYLTHPVGQKKPNSWGLYDMHGNVWEWVRDWHGQYENSTAIDPEGPDTGANRVVRGGSWNNNARYLRSAIRNSYGPRDAVSYLGFRLLKTLP